MNRLLKPIIILLLVIQSSHLLFSQDSDTSKWLVHTTNCKFSGNQKFSPFEGFQQEYKELFWMLEYLSNQELTDSQIVYARLKPLYAPVINRIIHLTESELVETRRDTSARLKYLRLDQFKPFLDWFDLLDSSKKVKLGLVHVKPESFYKSTYSMIFEDNKLFMSLLNDIFWNYDSFNTSIESIRSYQRYVELTSEIDQEEEIENDFSRTSRFALDSFESLNRIVSGMGGNDLWNNLIPLINEYKSSGAFHKHTLNLQYNGLINWCKKMSVYRENDSLSVKHFWFFVDDYEFSDTFNDQTLGVDLLSIRQALKYFPNLKSQRDFFGNIDVSQKKILPPDVNIFAINNEPWSLIYIPEIYNDNESEDELIENDFEVEINNNEEGVYFGPSLILQKTNTDMLNQSLSSRQLEGVNRIIQMGVALGFRFGEGNKSILSYGSKSLSLDENGSNYNIRQFQIFGSTRIVGNHSFSIGINESIVLASSTLSWFDNIPLNLSNPEPLNTIINNGFGLGIGLDVGLNLGKVAIEFITQYHFDITDNRWKNQDQFINSESSYSHTGLFVQSLVSYKLF